LTDFDFSKNIKIKDAFFLPVLEKVLHILVRCAKITRSTKTVRKTECTAGKSSLPSSRGEIRNEDRVFRGVL
jgi:hypothetical protein